MSAPALFVALTLAWALSSTAERRRSRLVVLARLGPAPAAGSAGLRARRRAAASTLALAVGALVAPVPAAVLVAGLAGRSVLHERRRPGHDHDTAVATLPDAVDLLVVAARAGLPALRCLATVAERAPPPWGPAFVAVAGRSGRGERFADALDELVRAAGEAGHGLRSVLRAAADDGADLIAGLERLGADARDVRRRRAEEAARRIPVRLLLPLVACSLPAFALLSIVPIVVGALRGLDL